MSKLVKPTKTIYVTDDVYSALKNEALKYMLPEDTLNNGIRKVLRVLAGITDSPITKEAVLDEMPHDQRTKAEDLLRALHEEYEHDIELELPSSKAWNSMYKFRWITINKRRPRTRRKVLGRIVPRKYGFIVEVYHPDLQDKKKMINYRIGKKGHDTSFDVLMNAFRRAYKNI